MVRNTARRGRRQRAAEAVRTVTRLVPFLVARAAMSIYSLDSSVQILSNPRLKGACLEGLRALDRAWRGVAIAAAVAVAAIVGSQLVGFRCTSVGFLA